MQYNSKHTIIFFYTFELLDYTARGNIFCHF